MCIEQYGIANTQTHTHTHTHHRWCPEHIVWCGWSSRMALSLRACPVCPQGPQPARSSPPGNQSRWRNGKWEWGAFSCAAIYSLYWDVGWYWHVISQSQLTYQRWLFQQVGNTQSLDDCPWFMVCTWSAARFRARGAKTYKNKLYPCAQSYSEPAEKERSYTLTKMGSVDEK